MFDTPVEELIADLNQRLAAMHAVMRDDVKREEERSRIWIEDRYRRFDREAYAVQAQRNALLQGLADIEATKPMVPQLIVTK